MDKETTLAASTAPDTEFIPHGRRRTRALPEPKAGETWHTTKPRCMDRKVLRVERQKYRLAVLVEGHGEMSVGDFHAWARRAEARPFPEA